MSVERMKNNIHYAAIARRDLDDIWDYIVADLCNPTAAANTVSRIMDAVDGLESFSGLGTPLSAVTNIDSDYRYLVSGSYMIFYRVNGNDVYVDRILYGRRDYLRILLGDTDEEEN